MDFKVRQLNRIKNNLKALITTASTVALLLLHPVLMTTAKAEKSDYLAHKKMRVPKDNQVTPARVELGKALFFDPRLSDNNQMSCATCHNPSFSWTDGLPVSIGRNDKKMTRSTPTILNAGYLRKLFWDGRARSLEEQAVGPIKSAVEMNQDIDALVKELQSINGYQDMFEKAYPGEGITETTIGKALATFERTIVSKFDAPFDRWLNGDQNAMSASAQNGFKLFDGKARCNVCHSGPNFTDGSFHNIGLDNGGDVGRYEFVKVDTLKGAFKTPTLRNVANTAPYMHNGELKTIEAVIDHYIDGWKNKSNLSPDIKPIKLTKQEKADLISFLHALSENGEPVTFPKLPN